MVIWKHIWNGYLETKMTRLFEDKDEMVFGDKDEIVIWRQR